tara:strand:- start:2059 stop:2238 length:180 start_codon:yes stop_codon:yes gene_type:complete
MLSALRHQEVIGELNAFINDNPAIIDSIRARYGITTLEALTQQIQTEFSIEDKDIWQPE